MTLRRLSPWLLVIATLAVYLPAVRHEFVDWDDRDMIVDNPMLAQADWQSLKRIWSSPYLGLYTPVTYTTQWMVAGVSRATFGGIDARVFHGANVLLHVANSLLVLMLMRRLVRHDSAALLGAVVFALHGIQVESVAWAASFNTLLATGLALVAIACAIRGTGVAYALAAMLFVLAMLAKPTVVALPLVIAVIELLLLHRSWKSVLTVTVCGLVLAIPIVIVGMRVQPASAVVAPAVWMRPLIAGDAITHYLYKLVWPTGFCIDYGRQPAAIAGTPWLPVMWVIPLVLLIAVTKFCRQSPAVLAGSICFCFALLPVLGFAPFDFQLYSTVADRYAYFGMFGIALVVSGVCVRLSISMTLVTTAVIATALAIGSALTLRQWNSTESLVARTAQLNPGSLAGRRINAFWLGRTGKLEEAIAAYNQVLALRPSDTMARFNLANALLKTGRLAPACAEYEMLQFQGIDDARLHGNFGFALMALGEIEPAGEQFRCAAIVGPTDAEAQANLGRWLEATGRTDEAVGQYRRALQLNSGQPIALEGLKRLQP